jgi:hypothetical protein
MIEINLSSIPNQSLTVQLGGFIWDITLKETKGVMSATISRDNELLIQNVRCCPGTPLLPYRYQESGNFMFVTNDDEYPYYTQFNNTQSLIFASQDELEVIRGT